MVIDSLSQNVTRPFPYDDGIITRYNFYEQLSDHRRRVPLKLLNVFLPTRIDCKNQKRQVYKYLDINMFYFISFKRLEFVFLEREKKKIKIHQRNNSYVIKYNIINKKKYIFFFLLLFNILSETT